MYPSCCFQLPPCRSWHQQRGEIREFIHIPPNSLRLRNTCESDWLIYRSNQILSLWGERLERWPCRLRSAASQDSLFEAAGVLNVDTHHTATVILKNSLRQLVPDWFNDLHRPGLWRCCWYFSVLEFVTALPTFLMACQRQRLAFRVLLLWGGYRSISSVDNYATCRNRLNGEAILARECCSLQEQLERRETNVCILLMKGLRMVEVDCSGFVQPAARSRGNVIGWPKSLEWVILDPWMLKPLHVPL